MKTSKVIALAMVALALSATPALAQRGGGSRGGGGSHSSSMGSSRSSGGSFSSGSRSSSSSSSSRSSSYSSPSRSSSSSSSSSSRSYSSPSRSSSSSSSSSSRSYSSPSRSSSHSSSSSSRSYSSPSRSSSFSGSSRSASYGSSNRSSAPVRSGVRGSEAPSRSAGVSHGGRSGFGGRDGARTAPAPRSNNAAPRIGTRGGAPRSGGVDRAPAGVVGASGRPAAAAPHNAPNNGPGYARPGRPGGVLPPSHRPIRPAPYFYHPWHHRVVHCHPIFWDPFPPRPWYWPGFWHYCNSYWYDYHVTDVVVVRQYVQDTYHVDMVTYGISGDIMYAIVRDGGDTYLQVYDKDDHLLAEQKINRKYCNMVIDSENGGCWISKKHEKDPLLFIWAEGQLLIYEAD